MKTSLYTVLFAIIISIICSTNAYTQYTWEELPLPEVPDVWGFELHPTEPFIYILSYNNSGVFKSSTQAIHWENIGLTEPLHVYDLCFDTNNMLYAYTHFYPIGGVHKYSGQNIWQHINTEEQPGSSDIMDCSPYSNHLFVSSNKQGRTLMMSEDHGATWIDTYVLPGGAEMLNTYAFKSKDTIFAGTTEWTTLNEGGMYRSVDGGYHWDFFALQGCRIEDICFTSQGDIIAAVRDAYSSYYAYAGIYKHSQSKGWNRIYPYPAFSVVKDIKGYIYAAVILSNNNAGVIMSKDNGKSWEIIKDTGFFYSGSESLYLQIDYNNSLYFLHTTSTPNAHLYRTQLFEGIEDIPNNKAVAKVYPNPFTQSTTVYYSLQQKPVCVMCFITIWGKR